MSQYKDLINETIVRVKEKYPDMDTFLALDYENKFNLISIIVEIHEESIRKYSKDGVDIILPFIGRLTIKDGKKSYNATLTQYLIDNNIKSKHDLTAEDRNNIIEIIKKQTLQKNLNNKKLGISTKVLTFKPIVNKNC